MRKTDSKTGGGASSQHANAGVNTTLESSQETTEKTTLKTTLQGSALAIVELIKRNPEVKISEIAEHVGLTRDGVNYRIRQLKKLIGLRHDGSDKNGRWVIGA